MPVVWTTPTIPGAPSFAEIDGVIVGYVTETAFEDGRWSANVSRSERWQDELRCYARDEARAKRFVESWLTCHAPDTSCWAIRTKMKPKGLG